MSSRTSKGVGRPRVRKRALLAPKSWKSARKFNINDLNGADAEFNAMPRIWNSFTIDVSVHDPGSPNGFYWKKTLFRRGDDIILNSTCDGSPDVWVGHINQIRTNAKKSKMLVKVLWYYSRNDVAEHIRTFKTSTRSPYERIVSDYYDYLSPRTLQAVTRVYEYDDAVLDPPQLGPTDFFVRSSLQFWRKTVKPPLGENTCLCQVPYNPYPELRLSPAASFISSLSSRQDALMHFCPRLQCRKWYHASCLSTMRHIDTKSPPSTRGLRLLAVDPHKDTASSDKLDIFHALEMFGHSSMIIAHLPPSLLAIAQSPIVRCSGAPDGWAIGNVADVVLARRFVYAAVEHSGPPEATEAFRVLLQVSDELDAFSTPATDADGRCLSQTSGQHPCEEAMFYQLCDGLAGFDLLASVNVPYWERRWQQFLVMQGLLEGPAFECPQCKSAI